MRRASVQVEGELEALKYKWIESERAGRDLGITAIRRWIQFHWWGYLRARWIEHLQGKQFWIELDRGDFGLLNTEFRFSQLLDPILDRLKKGKENLDIILWALDSKVSMEQVHQILKALDINSRRLVAQFDPKNTEKD